MKKKAVFGIIKKPVKSRKVASKNILATSNVFTSSSQPDSNQNEVERNKSNIQSYSASKSSLLLPTGEHDTKEENETTNEFDDSCQSGQASQAVDAKRLVNQSLILQQRAARQQAAAKKIQEEALKVDSSIFEYDDWKQSNDEQKEKELQKQRQASAGVPKQSKYIAALKRQAEKREQEHEQIKERRILREQEDEAKIYGETERFVTSAYKRKLEEQRILEEKARKEAEKEAAEDVTKKADLTDFYRNLLTKNSAFGAQSISQQPSIIAFHENEEAIPSNIAPRDSADAQPSPADRPQYGGNDTQAVQTTKQSANALDKQSAVHATEVDTPSIETVKSKEISSNKSMTAPPSQSKEDKIAAARRRFLERQKQKQ